MKIKRTITETLDFPDELPLEEAAAIMQSGPVIEEYEIEGDCDDEDDDDLVENAAGDAAADDNDDDESDDEVEEDVDDAGVE